MWFIPILFVCHIALGEPPDCPTPERTYVRLYEPYITHYYTYAECQDALHVMVNAFQRLIDSHEISLPQPWVFKGHCEVPVVDEIRLG